MEYLILTHGIEAVTNLVGVLSSLIFALGMAWVCLGLIERENRSPIRIFLVISLISVAVVTVDGGGTAWIESASFNLSKQTAPTVTHAKMHQQTALGNCRFDRTTSVWLIGSSVVRKKFTDGVAVCTPNKEN